ncbi:deoxyribonuclease YcfH [Mesobacillus boroniphilus JCM 21738]|uniref:Deoxyribonuclease YcfH n=1 Tax=Mesobacillus boroniphilus JCM 21738 TaxID=1294265 RepID=W4RU29_9BACI|nr:deoxyribonuclease YcfH [Mesobacillus boroniphilus JCM 21738]
MVETDCPYLTPHPYRGKRNEPAYVKLVAEQIAELKGLTLEKVAEETAKNAKKLFGIK